MRGEEQKCGFLSLFGIVHYLGLSSGMNMMFTTAAGFISGRNDVESCLQTGEIIEDYPDDFLNPGVLFWDMRWAIIMCMYC